MTVKVLLTCAVIAVGMMGLESRPSDEGKRIDELIMDAAPSVHMFDLIHDMGDGKMMVVTELDILMDLKEFIKYGKQLASNEARQKRKAVSNDNLLWPKGEVSYELAPGDFSARNRRAILDAMAEWENLTCVTFREDSNARNKIRFRNGGGCYSRLGMIGGTQAIGLAPGCRRKGIVIHEIGHAIGWIHEQARPDRDQFITVNFNQIPPNWRSQFRKVDARIINDRGVEYDYDSIMHYSGNVFGRGTIVTKDPADQNRIGQRRGLSFRDVKIANLMYRCAQRSRLNCSTRACPGEGFRGKDCRCYCRGDPVRLCDIQSTTTTPTPTRPSTASPQTTTAPPARECVDLYSNCTELKATNTCITDPARMMVFCRRTCELCDEDAKKMCMDYDDACRLFASNGYCEREDVGVFFQEECPLSCGNCTAPPTSCAFDNQTGSSNRLQLSPVLLFLICLLFKL